MLRLAAVSLAALALTAAGAAAPRPRIAASLLTSPKALTAARAWTAVVSVSVAKRPYAAKTIKLAISGEPGRRTFIARRTPRPGRFLALVVVPGGGTWAARARRRADGKAPGGRGSRRRAAHPRPRRPARGGRARSPGRRRPRGRRHLRARVTPDPPPLGRLRTGHHDPRHLTARPAQAAWVWASVATRVKAEPAAPPSNGPTAVVERASPHRKHVGPVSFRGRAPADPAGRKLPSTPRRRLRADPLLRRFQRTLGARGAFTGGQLAGGDNPPPPPPGDEPRLSGAERGT
jgi:hypothetical protein